LPHHDAGGASGSASPFHAGLHEARPHRDKSKRRKICAGFWPIHNSSISRRLRAVQDPYSLRCVPQVHGAVREAARHASKSSKRK